jgi:hypothetical protein
MVVSTEVSSAPGVYVDEGERSYWSKHCSVMELDGDRAEPKQDDDEVETVTARAPVRNMRRV